MTIGAPATRNLVLLGVVLMLVGDLMFALNDAIAKWLVTSFSIGQVLVVRTLGMFVVLGPMIARQGMRNLFVFDRPWVQFFRALAVTVDTALFYGAVVTLPLADLLSYYMAGPIYVAAMSHFMLGERVGWRRWAAILVGFIGVLVILKPTGSLGWGSAFALIGSICFALSIVWSRMLRGVSDTNLVTWQAVALLLLGVVMAIGNWSPMSPVELTGMIVLGPVAAAAHLLITRALKLAPASTLAPLNYSLLLWAVIFGYLFFNDLPGERVLVGSAIIVLAGLFIFHRQKVKGEPATAGIGDVV